MRKVIAAAVCAVGVGAADTTGPKKGSCGEMKGVYDDAGCKDNGDKKSGFQMRPATKDVLKKDLTGNNKCAGTKPTAADGFANLNCTMNGVIKAAEQAGADVSENYKGTLATNATPITGPLWKAGLCPVNVHWHLGAEHRSTGEFDENGVGPAGTGTTAKPALRALAGGKIRGGFRCNKLYSTATDAQKKEYKWKHCKHMKVGETYEVHWPHSTMGDCGGINQWQSPFYDGVFCNKNPLLTSAALAKVYENVGVEGQVFTIINDEDYFYPNLMQGAIKEGDFWKGVTKYTGSTTGTSRDNTECSAYAPITWQVDRKCHFISASTFDKMCADMLLQRDDMSIDIEPHGAREVVSQSLAADNHVWSTHAKNKDNARTLADTADDSDICKKPATDDKTTDDKKTDGDKTDGDKSDSKTNATSTDKKTDSGNTTAVAKKEIEASVAMTVELGTDCDSDAKLQSAACSDTKAGLETVMKKSILAGLKALQASMTIAEADITIVSMALAARRALAQAAAKRQLADQTLNVDYKVANLAAADADTLVADLTDTTKAATFNTAVKDKAVTAAAAVTGLTLTVKAAKGGAAKANVVASTDSSSDAATSFAISSTKSSSMMMAMALSFVDMRLSVVTLFLAQVQGVFGADASHQHSDKCSAMKSFYDDKTCCMAEKKDHDLHQQVVPMPETKVLKKAAGTNHCAGSKQLQEAGRVSPKDLEEADKLDCFKNGVANAVEQAGTDVTDDYAGGRATNYTPILTDLRHKGLCPVNVHWHLGAEHRSNLEYDENGEGPAGKGVTAKPTRQLGAGGVRGGFRCNKLYSTATDAQKKEYKWQHCVGMKVGETYEVHWPHSTVGDCGTPNQFQSPFYDGVFCNIAGIDIAALVVSDQIGVEGQVFTIINDEDYFYPDLMWGAIKAEGNFWKDVTKYTGSTTGTSRDNSKCSSYAPVTWHVDRKCHFISASTFDKMCADMKMQRDDMSSDLHAHGARELVDQKLAATNHVFDKNDRIIPTTTR